MSNLKGTQELAEKNINFIDGCSNNCSYCYARELRGRFDEDLKNNWHIMTIREKDVHRTNKHYDETIMISSSHDINDELDSNGKRILTHFGYLLGDLLRNKNNIVFTTKPRLNVIKWVIKEFKPDPRFFSFLFTITANDDKILSHFEPNASSIDERLECLKLIHSLGYETSVSIEPMLKDPKELVKAIYPYVTKNIWLGIFGSLTPKDVKEELSDLHSRSSIARILLGVHSLDQGRKIRLKDNIRALLNLNCSFLCCAIDKIDLSDLSQQSCLDELLLQDALELKEEEL